MITDKLNKEILDSLFTHIDQVVFVRDVRTSGFPIIYVNDAYTKIWPFTKEELYNKPESFLESIHPDDIDQVIIDADVFLSGKVEMETEYRVLNANNQVIKIKNRTFLTYDEEGIPEFIVGFAKNITDIEIKNQMHLKLNQTHDLIIQLLTQDLALPISGVKYLTRSAIHQINQKGEIENKEYIYEIMNQLNGVTKMLEDLLIYLEIQTNRVRLTYTDCEIKSELNNVISKYSDEIRRKKINLNVKSIPVYFNMDILHLQNILGNILSNAIKFTPDSGSIHIVVNELSKDLEVQFEDSGVGIPSNLLISITEPFKGGRRGLNGERSFSIGLYITNKLMQLINGTFTIQSEENRGTIVTLRFPKKQ